jgi:hypothetical protein
MLSFLAPLSLRATFRLPDVPGTLLNFTQTLDHFDPFDGRTFPQRYLLDATHESDPPSSLIVYISSEGALENLTGGPLYEIARRSQGALSFLELRFYGGSVPLAPTPSNFALYHTIAQTVTDIGTFVAHLRSLGYARVLLVGGGFAGTLAVYAREKFPHLVDFAWASSSLFHYELDYPLFNLFADQLLSQIDPQCDENTRKLTQEIDNVCSSARGEAAIRKVFNFTGPAKRQSILHIVIEEIAGLISGYTRSRGRDLSDFCELGDNFVKLGKWFRDRVPRPDSLDLEQYAESNASEFADGRSWLWQSCSEVGSFRTGAPGTFSDRNVTMEWFERVCWEVFDREAVDDDAQQLLQRRYADYPPNVSNLVLSFGGYDPAIPFHDLTLVPMPDAVKMQTFFIATASHCSELCAEQSTDSGELVAARSAIVNLTVEWLTNSCERTCLRGHCVLGECVCDDNYEGESCSDRTISEHRWQLFSSHLLFLPTLAVIVIGIGGWFAFSEQKSTTKLRVL